MQPALMPDQPSTGVAASRRAWELTVVVGALVVCSIGCAPPQSLETLPPLEPTTAETTPVTTPTAAATVGTMLADQVGSCVELVQFGAFTGDPELTAWWDEVGHDRADLRASCERLATEDPWTLSAMTDQWHEVRVELEVQQRDGDRWGPDGVDMRP